ncbi:hypothetical protein O7606_19625 [Micromonospora sp. WMMD882]|uniref:hypothetical protein n=1 Tax=Micromonospora sp. WMMD882 TaxID=3015151 RepID=UPI00248C386F|nr:hypothetical protein [Micromonospora sp. WMMD882]WBB78419.1 hypothetical protein O7606_19625 [Micromonospora sp. WMMD882]
MDHIREEELHETMESLRKSIGDMPDTVPGRLVDRVLGARTAPPETDPVGDERPTPER